MFRPRVIPCLLIQENRLVKTTQFESPRYIGDPVNAVHIFNQKEADELIFLDIGCSHSSYPIQYDLIQTISHECLMPFSYGGGIKTREDINRLFMTGCEKVIINTSAYQTPDLISEARDAFGSQSIICSIDVRGDDIGNYQSFIQGGKKSVHKHPSELAQLYESLGAGEIMVTSIDQDGVMGGYDIRLLHCISNCVSIPVIACGGAGTFSHFQEAIRSGGVSAVAAGSVFIYHGRKRAVLISYPTQEELQNIFLEQDEYAHCC